MDKRTRREMKDIIETEVKHLEAQAVDVEKTGEKAAIEVMTVRLANMRWVLHTLIADGIPF